MIWHLHSATLLRHNQQEYRQKVNILRWLQILKRTTKIVPFFVYSGETLMRARIHFASNVCHESVENLGVYMGTGCLGWQSNERWRQKPQKGAKWHGQREFVHPSWRISPQQCSIRLPAAIHTVQVCPKIKLK